MPDEITITKKSDSESTTSAAAPANQSVSLGRTELISLCAAGLGVSFFLPWANALFGTLSGFDLQKAGDEQRLLWAIPIFCAITIFADVTKRSQQIIGCRRCFCKGRCAGNGKSRASMLKVRDYSAKRSWMLLSIGLLFWASGSIGATAASLYTVIDLDTVGGAYSYATGINNLGQIIGEASSTDSSYPVLWANSGSSPTQFDSWFTDPSAINNAGQMVGYYEYANGGNYLTYFWTNISSSPLLLFEGYTVMNSINDSGNIVGCSVPYSGPGYSALFWAESVGASNILSGSNDSANGINNFGQIVGAEMTTDYYSHFGYTPQAILWANRNSSPVQLGNLEGNYSYPAYTSAYAINDGGQIVGYGNNPYHAVIWTNSSSPAIDLNTLIPANSGWFLIKATGVNDAGVIVGYGQHNSSFIHAFALVPNDDIVVVAGQIACTCDGSPIVGASVQIGNYSGTSANDGSYSITGIPSGSYIETVTANNYFPTNISLTVVPGTSCVTNDFSLVPTGQDTTKKLQILSGSVQWTLVNTGKTLFAVFTPQPPGLTLKAAACWLGYDHFNWYQQIVQNPYYLSKSPHIPYSDAPQYVLNPATGQYTVLNLLPDPNTKLNTWPHDALPFYWNENDNSSDPYDLAYPHNTGNNGTQLLFQDTPQDSRLSNGQYKSFITALVGIRNDHSFDWDEDFIWNDNNTGSSGSITPAYPDESVWQDTNGVGNIFDLVTNLPPSQLSAATIALIVLNGGSFPVVIQPVSQTVISSANVVFAISPSNSSFPLNYQWRSNGTNIANGTNITLQLSNVTTNSTGVYDAVLSNTNGSLYTAPATLTVLYEPMFLAPIIKTNGLVLSWIAIQGLAYQLQYTTNLNQTNWINIGSPITASNTVLPVTIAIGTNSQQFYRVEQH